MSTDYPTTPEFPYKHVIIVRAPLPEDDNERPPHFAWLEENISPKITPYPNWASMVSHYQYKGARLCRYGYGEGWMATFPDYCIENLGIDRKDVQEYDVIGIDDDELALQFALKFGY